MKIFGMGGFELVIILVVILLIFGPKNLPKLGSAIGKTVSNLRSGMNDGKKKKEAEAAEEQAASDEEAESTVAEIEGEVETVATDSEPAADPEPAVDSEPESVPDEIGDATAVEATSESAAAPKKVKRVVKKKAATGDSAETE